MIAQVAGTPVLDKIMAAPGKIVALEGSTGSSKTFGILQALLAYSCNETNKTYSVVRSSLPAHKRGALKDWKTVLELADVTRFYQENKTDLIWTNVQTGTRIEFFSLDGSTRNRGQKSRGPRRDRLFVNEGNELALEDWKQLIKRTRGQIYIDWNPSMLRHWIYDQVLTREDCTYIHSTYRDNTELSAGEIIEIEQDVPIYEEPDGTRFTDWNLEYKGSGHMVSGDPYHWSVYGLGQRGSPSEAIYPICGVIHEMPSDTVYGLDFGFNHPNVLLEVGRVDAPGRMQLHYDELIHEPGMTTEDLVAKMDAIGVSKRKFMYCDGARPEIIEALKRAGYLAKPADKTQGSVYAGIQFVKGHDILFTPRSHLSKGQFEDYRWQKRPDDSIDDKPVKLNDDAPDAGRYAAYTHWGKRKRWSVA